MDNKTIDAIHIRDEYEVNDALTKAFAQAKLTFVENIRELCHIIFTKFQRTADVEMYGEDVR